MKIKPTTSLTIQSTPPSSSKFKIKVTKSHKRQILIGVVEYAKQKDHRVSQPHIIQVMPCFTTLMGLNFLKASDRAMGLNKGDIVEADVNRRAGTIKYLIKDTLKATQTNNILRDSPRVFMPFVEIQFL